MSRRDALLAALATGLLVPATDAASAAEGDFITYKPYVGKTPALRAGLIQEPFYSMQIPSTWKEAKIPNILSGNFCMPGCAEPWIETVFENPSEGKLQLVVSPLVKLTNRPDMPIQDIGTPESILPRIGGYITGTYMEEEDLVATSTKVQDDGLTYYYYELYAPAANGHSLTAVTTKGEGCYLFVCSASDKAWKSSEPKLRQMVESFRV